MTKDTQPINFRAALEYNIRRLKEREAERHVEGPTRGPVGVAINLAIGDLAKEPSITASLVAERAARYLDPPVDAELLRRAAAKRLRGKWGSHTPAA